ncbi:MAG: TonB-dependent receptor [Bacteroidales bacterium]|nr:TonB-dependent receptor [Bacteroidales bacterium]
MRRLIWVIAVGLAMMLGSELRAQNPQNARGVVLDQDKLPIPGAGVVIRGTTIGAVTGLDGTFDLEIPSKYAKGDLEFSCFGYETVTRPIGRSYYEVTLGEEALNLDEAVVVGYGVQKKGDLTASVATVNQKALRNVPVDNITGMLGGKLPGLVSRQTTGLPGENDAAIYIRGVSTTGNSAPLVLVDGVEREFSNLDPSEIASITILKDAASAAVYGVKGANGVILVTTRRGDATKPILTYNGSVTFSSNTDMVELLDGPEYAYWHNLATATDNLLRKPENQILPDYSDNEIAYIKGEKVDPQGVFGNTDWVKLIFKDYAVGQSHNLTVSGGTDSARYFLGGSTLQQDGLIDNVWFKRYNLRSNVDVALTKDITLKLDISGRLEQRHQSGVSAGSSDPTASLDGGGAEYGYKNVVFYTISAKPTINPRMPDGTYIGYQNPLIARDESGFQQKENSFVQTALSLEYRAPWLKGLTARGMLSYDFRNTLNKRLMLPCAQVTPQYGTEDPTTLEVTLTAGNSPHLNSGVNTLQEESSLYTRYTGQAQINYRGSFGEHEVGADLVWEQSGTSYRYFTATKQNFAIVEIPDLDFSTEVTPNSVRGNHSNTGRQGLLLRANYSYGGRYLLQASVREDWSAKFAKDHRMGVFPAVSAGWRINKESWMKGTEGWLDNLKLRASWGKLGNDQISDFLYVQGVALSKNPAVIINGVPAQSLSTTSVPNSEITWETTTTWNAGADLSLWNGKLGVQADIFYKLTENILQSQSGEMPPSIGGNFPNIINGGVVDVKGAELVLSHHNTVGDLVYDISANASYAANRYISTNDSDNIPAWQSKLGTSLGSVLGYVSDGLYKDDEDLLNSPKTSDAVRVGDIKYKDLNGDGKITLEDRTWIAGPQLPKVMFGINLSAGWRWFDFNATLQGAALTDVMLCGNYSALGYSDGTYFTQAFKWGSNPPKYLVEGSWRPDNTDAEYPRLSTQTSSNNAIASDFWKRDASYIRLKNVQLGFTFPSRITNLMKIARMRAYVSGSNLFTLSKLAKLGLDPEVPSVQNGYYPQQRVLSAGLDITF